MGQFIKLSLDAGFKTVFALVPSIDMVRPDALGAASVQVNDVVSSGGQNRLFDWFVHELEFRGQTVLDLRSAFGVAGNNAKPSPPRDLFTVEGQLFVEAHRLLAEGLAPLVKQAMAQ